jgi:hypothetical protein
MAPTKGFFSAFIEYAQEVGRRSGIYNLSHMIEEANKTWPSMTTEERQQ